MSDNHFTVVLPCVMTQRCLIVAFRFFLYVFLAAAVVLLVVGAQQLLASFGVVSSTVPCHVTRVHTGP